MPSAPTDDELESRRRVAHELNDLLTIIAGYAELSLEHAGDGPLAAYQTEILRAADSASALASQLAATHRTDAEARLHATPARRDGARPVRVLLADDDAGVRKFTSAILSLNGYAVEAVESGAAALAACEREPGAFQIVVTDIRMGPMDGLELVGELAARWPQLPVLLVSGYPGVDTALRDPYGRRIPFLSKPYTNFQLLDMVRKLLGA